MLWKASKPKAMVPEPVSAMLPTMTGDLSSGTRRPSRLTMEIPWSCAGVKDPLAEEVVEVPRGGGEAALEDVGEGELEECAAATAAAEEGEVVEGARKGSK